MSCAYCENEGRYTAVGGSGGAWVCAPCAADEIERGCAIYEDGRGGLTRPATKETLRWIARAAGLKREREVLARIQVG